MRDNKNGDNIIMELIYFWTTATYPKTIDEPQGFNLSPEYDFCVKRDKMTYYVEENSEWRHHISIFQTDNISNLSVIVGENGAGKTTILRRILENAVEINKKMGNNLHDREYCPYPNMKIEGIGTPFLYIIILKTLKNKIHIYSSVPDLDCSRIRKFKPAIHDIGGRKKANLYKKFDFPFQNVTVLYLTNSSFSTFGESMSDYEGIHSITMTPDSFKRLEQKYYEGLLEVKDVYPYIRENNSYLTWQWIRYNQIREEGGLQNLLYILYFHKKICIDKNTGNEWKSPVPFSMHIQSIPKLLSDYICSLYSNDILGSNAIQILMITVAEAENCWNEFLPDEDLLTRILYFNLVIEVILRLEMWKTNMNGNSGISIERYVLEKQNDSFKRTFFDSLRYSCYRLSKGKYYLDKSEEGILYLREPFGNEPKPLLLKTSRYLCWNYCNTLKKSTSIVAWIKKKTDLFSVNDRYKNDINYINKAIDDVSKLIEVTKDAISQKNIEWEKNLYVKDGLLYELTDTNFVLNFHIDDTRNKKKVNEKNYNAEYQNVIECFNHLSENKHSYVLKYIKTKTLGMSSGEKAFLNFSSWLNRLPMLLEELGETKNEIGQSNKKKKKINYGLKNNLLFLLDEPDLYMHPQWQKKLVKYLIDELKSLYQDKRVQIIMTTSSPLTLSDVPAENTVRIKYDRETGKRKFDKHCQGHSDQTFGADIYKLFADSFFLQGSPMGMFAEKYINDEILLPLKEMRLYIWENEVLAAKGKNFDSYVNASVKQNFYEKLKLLSGKIEMISNVALYKKAYEMYDDIMKWCNI